MADNSNTVFRVLKNILLEAYFLARLPVLMAAKYLFRPRRGRPDDISKILVIRPDRLGDLVLSIPFLESLRAAYPSARIDIMVRPYLAGLAGILPSVNEFIVYKGPYDAARNLPARNYDIAVDMFCGHEAASAFTALFSKAPVRIGFSGGYRELLFTDPVTCNGAKTGMVELDLKLLTPLGVPVKTTVPRIGSGQRPSPLGGKLKIAVHPGGYYDSQRWGAEKFASLGRMLMEKYRAAIVIIGGPDDKPLVSMIREGMGTGDIKEAFPEMGGLAEILSGSDLLICNNSGPLHLAAALGVPSVSTMGPTDPVLWWPRGDFHVVVRKGVGCNPCSRGRCGDHRCLKLITAEEVFEKAADLIKRIYGIER